MSLAIALSLALAAAPAQGATEAVCIAPWHATGRHFAPGDREAISELFAVWQAAWNRHDMPALAALFHEDASWTGLSGRVWQGRAAIEAEHIHAHLTILKDSQQAVRIDSIAPLAGDVAIVRVTTITSGDRTASDGLSRARKLFVVSRDRCGSWLIAAGQNTRLAEGVPE
jgi:uncharacterized protein (TIGR02246 family)